MCVYKALGSSPGTIKQKGVGRDEMEARRRPAERETERGGDRKSGLRETEETTGRWGMSEKPKEGSHGAGVWCAHW